MTLPKNIRLNATHYFVMKIPNKREHQQIMFNHSSDIDFQDFMNLYKKCTAKPYAFFILDIILNATHYFVMKIPNKRELQQIMFNHSSDIDFQDYESL